MIFSPTKLPGVWLLDLERREDDRGHFARVFCVDEFKRHGLDPRIVQSSVSFNKRAGTLRGLHWQVAPKAETKLIRCTRGAIHDVVVDIREDSPTYLQHVAVELSAENGRLIYLPAGVAHGFQTLADNTEVVYQMSEFFAPECSRGARWNDPAFGLTWPLAAPIMNDRDRTWSDFAHESSLHALR